MILKGTPGYRYYLALRWAALIGGLLVCVTVLTRAWDSLPLVEVVCLGALGALAQIRPVILGRSAGSKAAITYLPGEGFFVIALLRSGPAAALAVALLAGALQAPIKWRDYVRSPLVTVEDGLSFPALFWLCGCLYAVWGGHRLATPGDSGLFFQDPSAILLPLAGSLLLTQGVIHRCYIALLMLCVRPALALPLLRDWAVLAFLGVESVCCALGLALWTAWGWSTLPFSLLITTTTLLSARNYLERVEARREAESDPLTGLASWRGLENFLERQITMSARRKRPFALLFLDVDGLKVVNDRMGHATGDALLALVGDCCRAHTRKNDLVGRRGGDEFLLVLDGLNRTQAEAVLARLRESITDALDTHPQFAGMAGASIGLATYPQDAVGQDSLIACADRGMYADKQARRAALAT